MNIMAMKSIGAVFIFCFFAGLLSSCKKEEKESSSYSINLKVTGNSLNRIYFKSANYSFDITENVPTKSWSVDNTIYGDDSVTLYGRQSLAEPLKPVVVKISLYKNNDAPIVFADSGVTEITLRAFIPY